MATVATSAISKAFSVGDAKLLPVNFNGVPMHDVHMTLIITLLVLVSINILGAVKHQIIDKDGLMDRMSFKDK
jgi:cytochrome b561